MTKFVCRPVRVKIKTGPKTVVVKTYKRSRPLPIRVKCKS